MKKILATAIMAATTAFAGQALSYEAGDIVLRLGAANVDPDGDGADIGGINGLPAGTKLKADDDTQLGITGTYMLTQHIGLGVLAATPFKHDINVGSTKVAETKHLPPTLTLQYHFDTGSSFRPFVGAGLNYTNFFEEDMTAAGTAATGGGDELELDDSFGLALEAGLDFAVDKNWLLSAQVWYLDIEPNATVRAGGNDVVSFDVEIDPWVYMVGVGYQF